MNCCGRSGSRASNAARAKQRANYWERTRHPHTSIAKKLQEEDGSPSVLTCKADLTKSERALLVTQNNFLHNTVMILMWEMSEYYSAKSQSYAFIWKASRLPSLMVSNSSWIATQYFLKQWRRFLEKSHTWENKQRPRCSSNKHLKSELIAALCLTRWHISEWVSQNQKRDLWMGSIQTLVCKETALTAHQMLNSPFQPHNYHSHLHISAHCNSASWFSVKQKGKVLWFCQAPKEQWTQCADSQDHKSTYRMTVHWPDTL